MDLKKWMVGGLIHSPHFQNRADWECDGEEKKIRFSYLLSILQIFGWSRAGPEGHQGHYRRTDHFWTT